MNDGPLDILAAMSLHSAELSPRAHLPAQGHQKAARGQRPRVPRVRDYDSGQSAHQLPSWAVRPRTPPPPMLHDETLGKC